MWEYRETGMLVRVSRRTGNDKGGINKRVVSMSGVGEKKRGKGGTEEEDK